MRTLLLLAGIFYFNTLFSQITEGSFYVYKEDWSPAKDLESASYFMHMLKESDTSYVCRYYQKNGPMIKWETYYDANLEIPNGRFAWYNQAGNLDSLGSTYRGRKDGTWEYLLDDSGRAHIREEYYRGKFLKRENFDSKTVQYPNGITESIKRQDSADKREDVTIIQTPAEFKGGVNGWTKYLSRELRTPDRFLNQSYSGNKATVVVTFIISKEGKVSDIFIFQSREWSIDTETIRVLKKSSDWKPAFQNGKPVLYRHKQSISFATN
jgi:protein TonB